MPQKEKFTTTLNGELLRRVKILGVNRRCSVNILLEEAMGDLLNKYGEERMVFVNEFHEPPAKYGKKSKK